MDNRTQIKDGYEGYGPTFDPNSSYFQPVPGITFYGYFPVEDHFSIVYRDIDQTKQNETSFSFLIDKMDAIYLEFLLKLEILQRRSRSETYYCKNVFLTCEHGSNPLISFPFRGFSIRFKYSKDYDELLVNLTKFLDSAVLDEQQKDQRDQLEHRLTK